MTDEVKLLPCPTCNADYANENPFCSDGFHAKGPLYWPCEHCAGTGNVHARPTIVTDEVVEPVGVLAEVREQLATLADKQADQRGDYLYRGQPDTWLLEAIRKLDTAIAAMPAIVGGE